MPAGHGQEILAVNFHSGLDNDEDVNGSPADYENRHDNQDHPGDPPQVLVLLFGARKQTDTLKTQDHQPIANGDDQDGHHEGKNEYTDFCHRVPVPFWFRKSKRAQSDS